MHVKWDEFEFFLLEGKGVFLMKFKDVQGNFNSLSFSFISLVVFNVPCWSWKIKNMEIVDGSQRTRGKVEIVDKNLLKWKSSNWMHQYENKWWKKKRDFSS